MNTLKDLYSVSSYDGRELTWKEVVDYIRKGLSSRDALYLMCATHILREDASSLVQWSLFQEQLRKQCIETITYKNSLWVELVVGPISFPERKGLKTYIPVTEIQMQAFDLAAFEIEVAAIIKEMSVFPSKDMRNFTKRLLVSSVAGQSKQQNMKLSKS